MPSTSSTSYARKAISGFSWQTVLKFSLYGLALIKIYFLARLLQPADFGLFSLTAVALGLSESLTQTGVNLTILQSKHSVKYFLDTAWVIAIIRGFIIGTIMILMAIGLSRFYQQPELLILTSVAALVPVIKGFINPYIVILHKKMLFFQDTVYRFVILSTEILLAIALGYWLRSAYALVLALVGSGILEVLVSFIFFKYQPSFRYISSRARIIFSNAKWLSISSVLNYLSEHLDDLIVGQLTNAHDLGIYHNAYSLTHKANYQISKSVHHGTIPILTRINTNSRRLRSGFVKTILATAAITISLSAPIYILAEPIVEIFLGEQWLEAVPLIRPLIIAGVVQSLTAICYTLFLSLKKYLFLNLHLIASLMLMVGLMWLLGSQQGLDGTVRGLMLSRLIAAPIAFAGVIVNLKKKN